MVKFYKLWEEIHPDSLESDEESPLMDAGDDSKSLIAIRNGLGLRKKQECGNFWDDFTKVCGNADALAALLGVRTEQVAQWASKIRKGLDKVQDDDAQDTKDKPETIKTGNDGPIMNQNGNLDLAQPGQTRPE